MEHFSWFTFIGMLEHDHILGAVLVLLLLVIIGISLKSKLSDDSAVVPDSKISLNNFFQVIGLDFLFDIFENIFGSKEKAKKYFPLLGGAFFFILFLNLLGVIPGFLPPTGSLNTTLAFGILIFVLYNYYGFREHGISYLKQFAGPVLFLAPLMIIIELISHLVRPISLSLRLFMNITGDHMVLGVFTNLTHLIVPAIFVGLGVFVSFLQAFIFTVLSAIYIALAESHSH
ncbi:MAG: F0F1 ATP synthase subunit A [Thermodesulfobacteriota bacterium]